MLIVVKMHCIAHAFTCNHSINQYSYRCGKCVRVMDTGLSYYINTSDTTSDEWPHRPKERGGFHSDKLHDLNCSNIEK